MNAEKLKGRAGSGKSPRVSKTKLQPSGNLIQEHSLVVAATVALGECYTCLSHTCTMDYLRQQASIFGDRVAQLHALKSDQYALLPKMHMFQELCSQGIQPSQGWLPREARDLIFKIRSWTVRSDLKNNVFSAVFCLFLRSDLTVQDRILKIRSLASLGLQGGGFWGEPSSDGSS